MNWQAFIDGIKDGAGTLAKAELKKDITAARDDANAFISAQGLKVQLYLGQLATGGLTKDQFAMFIQDIKDLTQMKLDQDQIAAAASAQRLINGVLDVILDQVLKLI